MIPPPGALGALIGEYGRALAEFQAVLGAVSDADFEALRAPDAADEDCRSLQTIAAHVVRSGYGYADAIRVAFAVDRNGPVLGLPSRADSLVQLGEMLRSTEATLHGRWRMTDEELLAVRCQPRRGPACNLEQLLEHAIVHVLRHRRQVQNFLASR